MKKLLVMCIVLLLTGVAKGNCLYPSNREVGVSVSPRLGWQEGREGKYLLYFWWLDEDRIDVTRATAIEWDTEEAGWSLSRTWAQVNGLEYGTKYYWRVDIRIGRDFWDSRNQLLFVCWD